MNTDNEKRRDGEVPFSLSRTFTASRERLWRAWTTLDELQRWFGPRGSTIPAATLDLRPGGYFHYRLLTADGQEMWGIWTFREISPPERLVLVQSFSDAQGGVARHPLSPTWPREILAMTGFDGLDDHTTITLRWSVLNGTEEEHQAFDAAHTSMFEGWSGTFDRLMDHLARG